MNNVNYSLLDADKIEKWVGYEKHEVIENLGTPDLILNSKQSTDLLNNENRWWVYVEYLSSNPVCNQFKKDKPTENPKETIVYCSSYYDMRIFNIMCIDSNDKVYYWNIWAELSNNSNDSYIASDVPIQNDALNNSNQTQDVNQKSSPNTAKKTKCGYCKGTGKCPYCNSAGQSLACVSNQFGVTCKDSYCIAHNHKCKHCNGTHICSDCKGTGYGS